MQTPLHADYEFSADAARLDLGRVHDLLTRYAYWAADRSREANDVAVAGSRGYGIYERSTGTLVAFARVVTDNATFGWLADVVVDPGHRRRGIARLLVAAILEDLEPLGLRRILLKASDDGMTLYPQLGWTDLEDPQAWMVRHRR